MVKDVSPIEVMLAMNVMQLSNLQVENRKGLKKDVVRTFPIVKASDLNADTSAKLQ